MKWYFYYDGLTFLGFSNSTPKNYSTNFEGPFETLHIAKTHAIVHFDFYIEQANEIIKQIKKTKEKDFKLKKGASK